MDDNICYFCKHSVEGLAHRCKFCKDFHCHKHLLPEKHDCKALKYLKKDFFRLSTNEQEEVIDSYCTRDDPNIQRLIGSDSYINWNKPVLIKISKKIIAISICVLALGLILLKVLL